MSKYDNMLAANKRSSEEKVRRAREAIITMVDGGERVSIPNLMEKTGLSRGFFYKNQEIRKLLERALEQQVGMQNPRRNVLDMAMNEEIRRLKKQVGELAKEKEELKDENEKLKKALSKRNMNILKGF